MTLPVSSYEELLVQVRELTHETILLQRQLSSDLYDNADPPDVNHNFPFSQRRCEKGKFLTDNVIRHCDKNRKLETGQNPLIECNNLRFQARFYPSLDCTESIRSGDLTSRLLAWRSRSHQRVILQEEVETRLKPGVVSSPRRSQLAVATPLVSAVASAHELGSGVATPTAAAVASTSSTSTLGTTPTTSSPAGRCAVGTTRDSEDRERRTRATISCEGRDAYDEFRRRAEITKEDAMEPEAKEEDERRSATPSPELYVRRNKRYNEDGSSEEDNRLDSSSQARRMPSSYRGTWPVRRDPWASQHLGFSNQGTSSSSERNDGASVASFSSSPGSALAVESQGQRRLGAKVDVVYNLLGMLGSTEGREDMSATLLQMSSSIENCLIMRQSGCLPLLVQLIHAPGQDPDTRERASRALRNIVNAKSDERAGRREARVLRFLEQLRDYCQALRTSLETGRMPDDLDRHPGPTIAALMKFSFDEAHRHAMCQLGGLHAVAELIEMDHLAHGSECDDQNCITLRRYAGMALTNLTFGDGNNKALLCSFREFMKALVSQLRSPSDDLRQVTASVLRNLSWRADSSSKQTLREVGAVTGLMKAAMEGRKEYTLKSILSALWNLSAHCSTNKVDICAVDGALAFLVDMLNYKAPSKTLAIVENAGGILRNVSSYIAVREDYRAIVRERGCLQILLRQLRSPSLTVVSNACGALWNLSARCPQDQRLLWDLGAVPMLRSLVHSKHKMISMGSSAALKNLLSARPGCNNLVHLDSTARGLGLPILPTLVARKQKALEQEIDPSLAETCDNIEPSTSPTNKDDKFAFKVEHSFLGVNTRTLRTYQAQNQPGTSGIKCNGVPRSESRESMRSVTSTHSDTVFERVNRHVLNGTSPTEIQIRQQSSSLHSAIGFDGISGDHTRASSCEKKYTLKYKNAIPERVRSDYSELVDVRCANSTISWTSAGDQESACSQILLHSSVEDNLSITSQSDLSAQKADSRSSISEEVEDILKVEKDEFVKSPDRCASLPFEEASAIEANYVYDDKSLLRVRESLDIQKTISPIIDDYAETDLDQPTDYSLRYAESEDEKQHSGYFTGNEQEYVHDDTIKTYCTEGTPCGTSLNSSRATSASDLQEEDRMRNVLRRIDRNKSSMPSVTRITGEKLETEMMQYFKNKNDFERVKDDAQEFSSIDSRTRYFGIFQSIRIVTQMATDNSVFSDIQAEISDHADAKLGHSEYDSGSQLCKDLSNEIVSYRGNATSKTSNDSGYQVSDGDEDDEDLLAACINIGMQNNRHRHSFIGNSFEKITRTECNLTRYQTSVALDQVDAIPENHSGENSSKSPQNEISPGTINTSSSQFDSYVPKQEKDDSKYSSWQDSTLPQNSESLPTLSLSHRNSMPIIPTSEATEKIQESPEIKKLQNDLLDDQNKPHFEADIPLCSNSSLNDKLSQISSGSRIEISENNPEKDIVDWKIEESNLLDETIENISSKQSESSESIDSVEQSEHALLELCIQSKNSITTENFSGKSIQRSPENSENISRNSQKLSTHTRDSVNSKNEDGSGDSAFESGKQMSNSSKNEKEDVYKRQRDPDAMIASLDRLTAALVQQTEAMRERDSNAMKQSTVSDSWNEDSPNDVSFPSISISAPLIGSFKSDAQEEVQEEVTIMSEIPEVESREEIGNDQEIIKNHHENVENLENFDKISNMTDSKIIQREAIKLAEAVDAEASKHIDFEATSMTSIDLDAIKPPSSMGSLISLTASYAGSADNNETFVNRDRCYSTSLPPVQIRSQQMDTKNCRKKSLPIGVVAKRAIQGQIQDYSGSMENLLNECSISHLESVKPPSMMDELPDVDMENSMLSVASITSEIADSKEHDSHSLSGSDPVFDLLKPVANVLSITCMRYAEAMQSSPNNSMSECLENINPPSLFNEVTELEESTMEADCSDTLCIDTSLQTDSRTIVADRIDEDTDEAGTMSSECCASSSAESTPKKRLKSHLTPKQKRNLAKERYRTYTIAGEIVKKEEEQKRRENNDNGEKIPRGKCSPFSKLTPKQRRQEDRARFQTQVLENPFPDEQMANYASNFDSREKIIDQNERNEPENDPCDRQVVECQTSTSKSVKSAIPAPTKLPVCKTSRRKRIENGEGERYRTRTLNDAESLLRDGESSPIRENLRIGSQEMQTMLEQNAIIVINTLNESSRGTDSIGEDVLLDCETLSLVSNDSESERSLRMRFVNGVSQKLSRVTDVTLPTNVEERREVDEENTKFHEEAGIQNSNSSASDDDSNDAEEQPQETKRPRIIKPGTLSRDRSADSNATDKSEPGSPKAIRGRRKALYSNPITRKSTPQSSPLKQANPISGIPIGRSNTSPIVRATRATTLRQNSHDSTNKAKESPKTISSPKFGSMQFHDTEKRARNQTVGTIAGSTSSAASTAAKRASVPQKSVPIASAKSTKRHSTPATCSVTNFQRTEFADTKMEPLKSLEKQGTCSASNLQKGELTETKVETPKPLERQGTFTKDEPEVENAPMVLPSSPVRTKIAKPVKTISKVHPVGKSKISVRTHEAYQTKISKTSSTERIQQNQKVLSTLASKRLPSGKTATKSPSTGQTAQGEPKVLKKVGALGQRSNSNSSIVSNASNGLQNRKAREATSKIASLWKKVEESKNKQRFEKPDSRQWITSGNMAEVDGSEAASSGHSFRLFRSSTFEGVPQEENTLATCKSKTKKPTLTSMQVNGTKYRNSCDLSGMNDAPCKIPVKSKDILQNGESSVVLRRQKSAEPSGEDVTKRISRLGSFIRVSPSGVDGSTVRTPASAIVPPFNYNPRPEVARTKAKSEDEAKLDADCHSTIVTASARVTTV